MILQRYYLGCLAHASYLIGDEETRTAVVVDPQRDVDLYLSDAHRMGLQIRFAVLSHFHADFVAGHLELRDRAGAEICLGARAQAAFGFRPLADGDVINLGSVRLKALETPGHTPEGISLLVYDLPKDPLKPRAVLTGDTLFIGDVGRPDLLASVGMTATDLAGMLYDSLRQKLLTLPDETLVYPAHGAGSMCGKNLSSETVSTIGAQRRYNYALQPMSREQFVQLVTADQPEAPAYFSHDAMLNRSERETLDQALQRAVRPLALEEVLGAMDTGAQVVDVRGPADFAGSHLAGSLNIPLAGKFASWAGALLSPDRQILVVADPGQETEAATRLARVGLDQMAGYLKGGMDALASRSDLLRRTDRITASTLAEHLASPRPPLVLDVRQESEWREKRVEGSLNVPLGHLEQRLPEVPSDRAVVVHCATGYRSSIAASILDRHGVPGVADLVGGISAWEASGLPVAP